MPDPTRLESLQVFVVKSFNWSPDKNPSEVTEIEGVLTLAIAFNGLLKRRVIGAVIGMELGSVAVFSGVSVTLNSQPVIAKLLIRIKTIFIEQRLAERRSFEIEMTSLE